jgi:hypothetical protein
MFSHNTAVLFRQCRKEPDSPSGDGNIQEITSREGQVSSLPFPTARSFRLHRSCQDQR